MKRLRVRWSSSASLDLIEIIEYIQHDQPAPARETGRAILRAASRLSRHPRSGRIVPELWEQGISDYRQIVVPPYRVIYAVREERVDIEVVIDSRRDLHALLLQRLIVR